MSRAQLWAGLLLRARDPGRFNSALSCSISEPWEHGFVRHINAGGARFREQVVLQPLQKIHTCTDGLDDQIHAESITTIEEPVAGYLFVRFQYRRDLADGADLRFVEAHLKSAYRQLDLDAIALIRQLAEENPADSLVH